MYNEETNNFLKDKIIKSAKVDGFGMILEFTDGSKFEYEASDGGYSLFQIIQT